ncbi:MAG: glycosyltransferase family 2 protein [Alphaproteobacteria bacterium]|nr:glycosyltransferase family 2 protein [Alphaproteobacteria bacterium]
MLTTAEPKISVLIAVYNAAPFIRETISAVLAQTYTDFELILLDDASTDNSADIIAEFKDSRLKYVRNAHNFGIAATRNRLAAMAKGEYIAVLDHDDICLPERLAVQADFLDKHNDVDMIGSYFELFCPPQAHLWRRLLTNLGWVWCHPLFPDLQDLWRGNVLMHPTIMYRRARFAHAEIAYRGEYSPAEDYDLVRQAMLKGLKLCNIPQVLLKYRLYGGNWSLQRKQAMLRADRKIKDELQELLQIKGSYYPYWKVMLRKLRLKFLVM